MVPLICALKDPPMSSMVFSRVRVSFDPGTIMSLTSGALRGWYIPQLHLLSIPRKMLRWASNRDVIHENYPKYCSEYGGKRYEVTCCPPPRNQASPASRSTELDSMDINSWGVPDFRASLKGFTVSDLDVAITQLDVTSETIVVACPIGTEC